jgi:hypothetical protein
MKSKWLAALYNRFMKIHQSIFNHLIINPAVLYTLHCSRHFATNKNLQEVQPCSSYWYPLNCNHISLLCWTFLHHQSFMLVLHVCKSCYLYLQAKGRPTVTGMVDRGFSHWISISLKYTYWTDNVWSRDTNTHFQHNQPEMNDNTSHLTYFLRATDTSRILPTLSQAKTCHMLQHSVFFPHHLWMNTPDGCLYLTYFEEYYCNALQQMAYKV